MATISHDEPYRFCYLYYLLFSEHWKGCKMKYGFYMPSEKKYCMITGFIMNFAAPNASDLFVQLFF